MTTPFTEDVIWASVRPTIRKFAYEATLLGVQATQVYNVVSGLTPPQNRSFGRYFDSGDPLLQYQPFSGSVSQLIAQGITLRTALATSLTTLVSTSRDQDISTALAPAVYAAFRALVQCSARPLDTINAMVILAGFQPPPITLGTDTIGQQIGYLAARVAALIRVCALQNLGQATALYTPTSSQDAIALRNQVASLIDAEIMLLASWYADVDIAGLQSLRSAVVSDLNARGSNLNPVTTQTFGQNLPSLVIAFQLYQDASVTMHDDLVARNDVPNPGFMPLTVEALSSAP